MERVPAFGPFVDQVMQIFCKAVDMIIKILATVTFIRSARTYLDALFLEDLSWQERVLEKAGRRLHAR